MGLKTFVFLPWDTEQSKILNALVYGATLVAVRGTYDDVNRLCSEIADQRSWAFCNINVRPYYSEGSKTLAFETAEQLGVGGPRPRGGPHRFRVAPDQDHQGLRRAGQDRADRAQSGARLRGPGRRVQPRGQRLRAGLEAVKPVQRPDTIAKSLAIGNPADGYNVLRIVRERGGAVRDASNEEIAEGMRLLAATEGVFAETAGGVTVAVLQKLVREGVVRPDERVVAYITGNGLKTLDAVAPVLREPQVVEPTLKAFDSLLRERDGASVSARPGA